MGWSIYFKTNKEITTEDFDLMIKFLPKNLVGLFGNTKCSWGISAKVDIDYPRGNELRIGGAYSISGDLAEPARKYIKNKLKELGYQVKSRASW